jgi:hypothetical protein
MKGNTYTSVYKAINKIYEDLGINTTVNTQLGRKSGASHAENAGASQSSVDKQGQWSTNSRNGAYSNNVVPWDAVRVLAGYQTSHLHEGVIGATRGSSSTHLPEFGRLH